jgi:HPt (histidine-containing phosphotransfer) domain-containing protein
VERGAGAAGGIGGEETSDTLSNFSSSDDHNSLGGEGRSAVVLRWGRGIVGGMALLNDGQLAAVYDLAGEQLGELLEEFGESSRGLLGRFGEALERGERAAAEDLMHELRGGAGSLGLAGLQEVAGQLEEELRAGREPRAGAEERLGALLEESLQAVRAVLAGRARG